MDAWLVRTIVWIHAEKGINSRNLKPPLPSLQKLNFGSIEFISHSKPFPNICTLQEGYSFVPQFSHAFHIVLASYISDSQAMETFVRVSGFYGDDLQRL
jgi:hypothetical protein